MKRGLFISIEKTGEGLGGSTQATRLTKALKKLGIQTVTQTREPGSTEVGEQIRQILLNGKEPLAPATELLLFTACRAQLYHEVLKPALEAGHIVICDRFFDSTLAYQGAGRGWSREVLGMLHDLATGYLIPDITFVLHGVPHRSRSSEDRFEALGDDFYGRVKQCMLDLASSSNRYVLINANQSPEEITRQMIRIIRERFPNVFTLQ